MQQTVFLSIFAFFECLIRGYLFYSLLELRFNKKISLLIYGALTLVGVSKYVVLHDYMALRTGLEWIIIFTALFVLFSGSIWKKLGVMFLYIGSAIMVESLVILITSIIFHSNVYFNHTLAGNGYLAYIFDLCALFTVLVIAVQIIRRKKENIGTQALRFVVIYFFLQALTMFILYLILWDYQIQALPVIITSLLMVLLSIAFGIMLYRMMRASIAEKAKADQMAMQMELANEHFGRLQVQYEQYRRLRHDYYNHIKTIRAMKDADARDTYIAGLTEQIENLNGVTFCTNAALDALLFNEKTQADALGVRTDFKIADIDGLRIPDIDICTVVSNLLDNAIRGAAEAPGEPFVSASVFVRAGQLLISVKNSCKAPNDTLKTTKPQKNEHGLGLNIVRDIAKKYDGAVAHSYENGVFSYTVSMSL